MLRCIHYLEIRQNPSGSKFNLFLKNTLRTGAYRLKNFFSFGKNYYYLQMTMYCKPDTFQNETCLMG